MWISGAWDGKKRAILEVCVPRINNRAEPRESKAFWGEWRLGFSRADWVPGKAGVPGRAAVVSGVRDLVIRMAFRPRV